MNFDFDRIVRTLAALPYLEALADEIARGH